MFVAFSCVTANLCFCFLLFLELFCLLFLWHLFCNLNLHFGLMSTNCEFSDFQHIHRLGWHSGRFWGQNSLCDSRLSSRFSSFRLSFVCVRCPRAARLALWHFLEGGRGRICPEWFRSQRAAGGRWRPGRFYRSVPSSDGDETVKCLMCSWEISV